MAKRKTVLHDADKPGLMPGPADFIGWVLFFFFAFAVYAVVSVIWNSVEQAAQQVQSTSKEVGQWTREKKDELLVAPSMGDGEASRAPQAPLSDRLQQNFSQQLEKTKKEIGTLFGNGAGKPFDPQAASKESAFRKE